MGLFGLDLVGPEVGHALHGNVLAEHVLAEQVRQAVDGIRRREQRPASLPGEPDGGGGEDSLAHAALAAEEEVLLRGVLAEVPAHGHRDSGHRDL